MPPVNSKDFKKRYSSSKKSVKDRGVWSGRGIAIPSLGAMDGSGDGSKYLGRPRRPFSKDNLGSPSQSADSGTASYMARVNKGYDEEYYQLPMFPEQELEDDDIYHWDDIEPVISRKLPRSFKVAARHRIRESDLISEMSILDEDIPDVDDLESSRLIKNAFDFFADLALDLTDTATADTGSWISILPALGTNIAQLWLGIREAKDVLYDKSTLPTADLIIRADDISKDIRRDLVDIFQALIRLAPAPGADDLVSIGITVGSKVLPSIFEGSVGFSASKAFNYIYTRLGPIGKFIIEWNPGTGGPLIGGILVRSIEMLGKLRKAIDEYKEYIEKAKREEENMASSTIEDLKDLILKEIALYTQAKPVGYEYREVPTVVKGEDKSFEVLDDYDDLAVVYKTDGGIIAYQNRDRLEEMALRNIIRDIISEGKKKR